MPTNTLVLGACLAGLALVAACGSGAGTTGSGGGASSASGTTGSGGSGTASATTGSGGAASGTGGAGTGGTGAGGACVIDPTFAEILAQPLSGCAGHEPPCHNGGAGMLHIDPADAAGTWGALVNVPSTVVGAGKRVVPGDPAHSFLYRKLINDLKVSDGAPMPASGLASGWTELPADQLEMVRCWILSGAKNN
jgi:hypothetical protein